MEKFIKNFKQLSDNNHLFHAYLFFGLNQPEILNFAKSLANYLENKKFDLSEVFLNDYLEIFPSETGTIGINEVRNLKNFLYQTKIKSKNKTAIIFQAEALTSEAQSSLLKIIEEPPQDSLIIFISNQEENLLKTITSRVHKIYFHSKTQINTNDARIITNKKADKDDLELFITHSIEDLSNPPTGGKEKNAPLIKEFLDRLFLSKMYNLNKGLQARYLKAVLSKKEGK